MSFDPTLTLKSVAAFGLFASTLALGTLATHPASDEDAAEAAAPGSISVTGAVGEGAAVALATAPRGADGLLTVRADTDRGTILPGHEEEVRVRLTLRAEAPAEVAVASAPTDLLVVLDTSGSMEGEKLAEAKEAIEAMTGLLAPGDRLGLMNYADGVSWPIPLADAQEEDRDHWRSVVSALEANGSTNIEAALLEAHGALTRGRAPGAVARVVLLSDGQPTAGETSPDALIKLAQRAGVGEYSLSTLGFGDDYNETLMARMADRGQGNFYYIRGGEDLQAVFKGEFEATRRTVVEGVAVTLQVPQGVEIVDVSGYPLEAVEGGVSFYPGTFFDGQSRTLWATLKVSPGIAGPVELGSIRARYRGVGETDSQLAMAELGQVELARDESAFVASLNADVWAQGVAEEGMGALKQQVAEAVSQGNESEAREKIEAYRSRNEARNLVVGSALVTANLKELGELSAEVEDAFQGEDQYLKQNVLTKKSLCNGMDTRRAGSKFKH